MAFVVHVTTVEAPVMVITESDAHYIEPTSSTCSHTLSRTFVPANSDQCFTGRSTQTVFVMELAEDATELPMLPPPPSRDD